MSVGSWLRDRPHFLELVYQAAEWAVKRMDPLISRIGYRRVERLIVLPEEAAKQILFDCRMCGQCILHSTGMTCPMTCPKHIRNGPCGGVRENGHCEVKPEMKCIWVEAYQRSLKMPIYGEEFTNLQPPVNKSLRDRAAWITMLTGEDREVPAGWEGVSELTILDADRSCWFENIAPEP